MAGQLNSITYRPIETWPGELTRHRRGSQFSADFRSTVRLLSDEVDHLTDPRFDTLIVVQLAVDERELRRDGSGLLANVQPEHPGVIVSFESDDAGPLRFSCDRYDAGRGQGWRHNLRAIALGLQALRAVDRYGLGSGREQYTGFGALPPGAPTAMGPATMTIDQAQRLLELDAQAYRVPEDVRRAYRRLAPEHHPDRGGDPDRFRELTLARDLLLTLS